MNGRERKRGRERERGGEMERETGVEGGVDKPSTKTQGQGREG